MESPDLEGPRGAFLWLFSSQHGARHHFLSRWFVLRTLGLIYFSAFFSLAFQIHGLIGPNGLLPAGEYLQAVQQALHGIAALWYAPSLLWLNSGNAMLSTIVWAGMAASLLAVLNIAPRWSLLVCLVCFESFVSAASAFSEYQSDGMLLEMGFLALFFAPPGLRPGLGRQSPPMRAALLLLLWEWFRIYFESGVVKLASGDQTWRHLTAMYEYYQNGPLPTWIGWYLQHLPYGFQRFTAGLTLVMELGLVFLAFPPKPVRTLCFVIVTVWQAGVILTANYCFLNYLVLVLGFLLLDDRTLLLRMPARWRTAASERLLREENAPVAVTDALPDVKPNDVEPNDAEPNTASRTPAALHAAGAVLAALVLVWIFYATDVPLVQMVTRKSLLPVAPAAWLEPLRIANQYGLFATMTPHRYEIEFQGSRDGRLWQAYPFRFKPQNIHAAPGIYAPYQPRFEWNLWFASLGAWTQNPFVPRTEEHLLNGDRDVLALFESDPFAGAPPRYVRAVLWQYWFTTPEQKRQTGDWWRRQLLGTYAPTITRSDDGGYAIVQPASLPDGAPQD